jgi:endogenous inhibitor of DNA gyrase (YacG/DUF329 family)
MRDLGNWASEKYVVSEPVFDANELGAEGQAADKTPADEDEDLRGFSKPNGTIH